MKKMFKTVISIVLALTLCIGISSFAYAEESEMSLEDILGLLSSLSGTDDGGEAALDDMTSYTLGEVSFSLPSSWTVTESEDYIEAQSDNFSDFISVSYTSSGFGAYDITDPSFVEMFGEASGQAFSDSEVFYIDEYPALKITTAIPEEDTDLEGVDINSSAKMLFIAIGDAGFNISYYSLTGDYSALDAIVESITIGEAAAPEPAAAGGTDAVPAEIDPNALDAVALGGEVVLIDNDICTVSLKKFSTDDDYYGFTTTLFTENKTDLNLEFDLDELCVNGYICDSWWYADVSAGHKANNELYLYQDDLDLNGITDIRDLSFVLKVSDADNWDAEDLVNEAFTVYPFGPDVPAQPEQVFDEDALVVVDNDDVKIVLTGFSADDYYLNGYVYLENKTDILLEFSTGSASTINGYEIQPYLYFDIPAGKKANTSIHWYMDDLELNDITTVEDIELELIAEDPYIWDAEPIFRDTYSVVFE